MYDVSFTGQVASLFEVVSVPPQAVQLWFWACVVASVWLVMLIRSEPMFAHHVVDIDVAACL